MVEHYNLAKALETAKFSKINGTNRVIRYFPNSDLRCSHDGLRKVALDNGVDPWKLSQGEFLVFSNTAQNKIKVYAAGNLLAYLKAPNRIDMDVVRQLPRFFNGRAFDFDAAVKTTLLQKLSKAA